MTEAMFAELTAVIGMANELTSGCQMEVDGSFKVSP